MTEARSIAKKLRLIMNKERWSASDVQRGLVVIINGRMGRAGTPREQPETPPATDPLECKT